LEGGFCSLEVLEVLEMPGVIRSVLLCMLEVVEGRLCLLEVLEGWVLFAGGVEGAGDAGGDTVRDTLYA
jgi:hypothetical protein